MHQRSSRETAVPSARTGKSGKHCRRVDVNCACTRDGRVGTSEFNRQATLAMFSEFALRSDNLDHILTEACRLIGDALGTRFVEVIELQPDSHDILVCTGVGWRHDTFGLAKLNAIGRTPEQFAPQTGEPVMSPNMALEDRFDSPRITMTRKIKAMATVVIDGAAGRPAFGLLQIYSRTLRVLDAEDTQFLRHYANVLAAAVERLRIVRELRERAETNERLLRELQHRVKNNLQTVVSLVGLRIHAAASPEVAAELRAIGDRIEALRLAHASIYRNSGSLDRTPLGSYLAQLAATVLEFHGREVLAKIKLVTEVDDLDVPADIAIPLGLVMGEFLTNSLKHAFGQGGGVIGLRVERRELGIARVALWDDGPGLPEQRSGGTGLQLIEGLVGQIGGRAAWSGTGGARLDIELPLAGWSLAG